MLSAPFTDTKTRKSSTVTASQKIRLYTSPLPTNPMPRNTRSGIAVIATTTVLYPSSLRRYVRMGKCSMCGKYVEGRYVCKSCEKKVKGNLNASHNPCYQCDRRSTNCHSHCRDYLDWAGNRLAVKDIIYHQRLNEADVFNACKRGRRKK